MRRKPNQCSRRKGLIGRINNGATSNERNLMGSSNSGRNVRLHIDSCCARLRVKQLLSPRISHRAIHSDDFRLHSFRKSLDKGSRPSLVSWEKLLPGFDRCRSDPVPCDQIGRQSYCNSKAYDARSTALNCGLEGGGEARALTADDGYAGASGDASL